MAPRNRATKEQEHLYDRIKKALRARASQRYIYTIKNEATADKQKTRLLQTIRFQKSWLLDEPLGGRDTSYICSAGIL